jgi:hypothetical protein
MVPDVLADGQNWYMHPNSNHINSSISFLRYLWFSHRPIGSLWRWRQAPPKRQSPTANQRYILRSNFKKFPEFAGIFLQELLYEWNFCIISWLWQPSSPRGWGQKERPRKNGDSIVGFSFTKMLQHTGRCCQGFLNKGQCDNTTTSPILSWPGYSWDLPVSSNDISVDWTALLWCYWH